MSTVSPEESCKLCSDGKSDRCAHNTERIHKPIGGRVAKKPRSKKIPLGYGDTEKDNSTEPLSPPAQLTPLNIAGEGENVLDIGEGVVPPGFDSGTYMGPSHAEDPYLAKFIPESDSRGVVHFVTNGIRLVDEDTPFTIYSRECECDTVLRKALETKWKKLEAVVAPFRDQLLALYFKFVDWTFPAVDKKRFYKAYFHADPPLNRGLVAGMLGLGATYWKYSSQLCVKPMPQDLIPNLWAVSLAYIDHDINCKGPTLDTVQALLLYTQKRMASDGMHEQVAMRIQVGKLVSMAFSLGLHVDCEIWDTSDKISRRRLWALVYYVDKWSSANLGHPSLLGKFASNDPKRFHSDFPQEHRFVQLIRLTSILSEVLTGLYPSSGPQSDPSLASYRADSEKARQLLAKLNQWKLDLPSEFADIRARNDMRYCSNGMLHLSSLTIESLIYRVLLRPAYSGKYRHGARDLVQRIILFSREITHTHLHAFWLSSCRLSLSSIAHFVLRYHAQSPPHEREGNTPLMRSWVDTLRALNHGWEEGIGLALHRMDALFHKGATSLSLPMTDETLANAKRMAAEHESANSDGEANRKTGNPDSDKDAGEEDALGLEEDLVRSPYEEHELAPDLMTELFTDKSLRDILSDLIWD